MEVPQFPGPRTPQSPQNTATGVVNFLNLLGPFGFFALDVLSIIIVYYFLWRFESQISSIGNRFQPKSIEYTDKSTSAADMAPAMKAKPSRGTHLMDSGLDNIQVPILHPKQTNTPHVRTVRTGSGGLLDGGLDDLTMIPVLEPERKPLIIRHAAEGKKVSTVSKREIKAVPWDGKIRWALDGPSVFEDKDEEVDAYRYFPNLLARRDINDIWLLQYGIRYVPAPEEHDVFRTVKIEGFATNTTLSQILSVIICGEIYSARLLNTTLMTGSPTAIVVFVKQSSAYIFVHAFRTGLIGNATLAKARASVLNTPTYPMTAEMQKLISYDGYTRSMTIHGVRSSLTEEVRRVLKKSAYADYVEYIEEGDLAGETRVRFYSIKTAREAHELFKVHPSFRLCKFRFVKAWGKYPTVPKV